MRQGKGRKEHNCQRAATMYLLHCSMRNRRSKRVLCHRTQHCRANLSIVTTGSNGASGVQAELENLGRCCRIFGRAANFLRVFGLFADIWRNVFLQVCISSPVLASTPGSIVFRSFRWYTVSSMSSLASLAEMASTVSYAPFGNLTLLRSARCF